jgi:hypothetical protein
MAHKHGRETDQEQSESKAYETRDVKVRPLAVFIAGLSIVGIVVYLVVLLMFRLFSGQAATEDARLAPSSVSRPASASVEDRLPPEPRIQANPGADMRRLREQDEAVLTTYGWVDRPAGIARIPIDVAMSQVLEEGLPVRQPDSAPPAAGAPRERDSKPLVEGPSGGTKRDWP